MLTRPKFNDGLKAPDLSFDSSVVRSARDLVTDDLPKLVRRADVPRRVETGVDVASGAIRSAAGQLPGRRRRSSVRPWLPAIVIVGVLAVVGLTTWWLARRNAASTAIDLDWDPDREALERATSEGMAEARRDLPAAQPVHASAVHASAV
jgi:hypothetical protein